MHLRTFPLFSSDSCRRWITHPHCVPHESRKVLYQMKERSSCAFITSSFTPATEDRTQRAANGHCKIASSLFNNSTSSLRSSASAWIAVAMRAAAALVASGLPRMRRATTTDPFHANFNGILQSVLQLFWQESIKGAPSSRLSKIGETKQLLSLSLSLDEGLVVAANFIADPVLQC